VAHDDALEMFAAQSTAEHDRLAALTAASGDVDEL
jgi:hypothetical protein